MDLSIEESQRKTFRSLLLDLANPDRLDDPCVRSNIYRRLESLYYSPDREHEFRHFYSDIFMVVASVKENLGQDSMDILSHNLEQIRKGYHAMNRDENGALIDIERNINKLYDHVCLEIARISYSDAEDRKLSQESSIKDIRGQVEQLKTETQEMTRRIEETNAHSKDVQKEYIAILGIFAAVVLAFTGGIAFTTSVLQNIHMVSVYRIVLITSLIGLVLTNVMYGLFHYIDRIVNRANTVEKKRKGNHMLFLISNGVLILVIAATVIGWAFAAVERRNALLDTYLEAEMSYYSTAIDTSNSGDGLNEKGTLS